MEVTSFREPPNLSMADLLFLFCGVPQLRVLHLIGVVGSDGPEVIEDFHSCVVFLLLFFFALYSSFYDIICAPPVPPVV